MVIRFYPGFLEFQRVITALDKHLQILVYLVSLTACLEHGYLKNSKLDLISILFTPPFLYQILSLIPVILGAGIDFIAVLSRICSTGEVVVYGSSLLAL